MDKDKVAELVNACYYISAVAPDRSHVERLRPGHLVTVTMTAQGLRDFRTAMDGLRSAEIKTVAAQLKDAAVMALRGELGESVPEGWDVVEGLKAAIAEYKRVLG